MFSLLYPAVVIALGLVLQHSIKRHLNKYQLLFHLPICVHLEKRFNTLTPMSDQDSISSLQYQYKIKKTSDENREKYQLEDYWLIQYQILRSNIRRIV